MPTTETPYILIRGEMPGAHGLLWWAVLSDGSTVFNEPGRSISGVILPEKWETGGACGKPHPRGPFRGNSGSAAVRWGYLQGYAYGFPHYTIRAIVENLPISNS
jgi:hypothetical protein